MVNRTDEEQVEMLKQWWAEYGTSVIMGVVSVVILSSGYGFWKSWKLEQAQYASALYQKLTDIVQKSPGADAGAQAVALVEQLRKDHANSVYATYGSLLLAKLAVDRKDLPAATRELQWALDHDPETSLLPLIHYRKAAVQYAQGQYDDALKTLLAVPTGKSFLASHEELKGDILLAQGKRVEAREAYRKAIESIEDSGAPGRRQYLEVKYNDLVDKVDPSVAPAGMTGKQG